MIQNLRQVLERDLFPYIEKPVRYIGNELNTVNKDLDSVDLHGVLCFPETYEIGMSHYGSQILYHCVNDTPNWALSRCYHPWLDAEAIMRSKKIPLYDLEYFRPVRSADWVGFSIQYELQYTNILNMLDLASIPLHWADRADGDPLIVGGGPCTGNPEPLASFFDLFIIGDGEESVMEFCGILERCRRDGADRRTILESLDKLPYVYIPRHNTAVECGRFDIPVGSGKSTITAAKVAQIPERAVPQRQIIPLMETVHRRAAIEVMRGCTRGCRFCSAGIIYRPVRERTAASITAQIHQELICNGWGDISLLSLSTADYTGLIPVLGDVRALRDSLSVRVSLPSTRIDSLTKQQMELLHSVSPVTSFTIAPEAGSQRLRDVINKDFSRETILHLIDLLIDHNIQTVKLYFMIGLPTETTDDINELIDLVNEISSRIRRKSKRREINVAISPFSPKSHTPFQWDAMDTVENLLAKSQTIKRSLASCKNVSVSYRDPRMALLETVFARGDRKVGALIEKAWELGSKFEGWDEQFNYSRWEEASRQAGVLFSTYTDGIDENQRLPWALLSMGVTDDFLKRERQRAYDGIFTPDCRNGECSICGVCSGLLKPVVQTQTAPLADAVWKPQQVVVPGHSIAEGGEKAAGTIASHYRFSYMKGRSVRFLSHKNVMTILQQAFAASGLPIAYSQGFHPHPKISFGPPLPVGCMGECECIDVVTTSPIPLELDIVNRHLPRGLALTGVRSLEKGGASLSAAIIAASYSCMPLFDEYRQEDYPLETMKAALQQGYFTRDVEEDGRSVQTRHGVLAVTRTEFDGLQGVKAILGMSGDTYCRPSDFIAFFFSGKKPEEFLIIRNICFESDGGALKPVG